jgi:hypothetical protein
MRLRRLGGSLALGGVLEKLFRQWDELSARRQERIAMCWRRMEIWKVLGNKCALWRILLVGGWLAAYRGRDER